MIFSLVSNVSDVDSPGLATQHQSAREAILPAVAGNYRNILKQVGLGIIRIIIRYINMKTLHCQIVFC